MHIRCQEPKAVVMNNSKSHSEALKADRKGSARPAADQEHVPAPSRPARRPSAGRPGLPSRGGCRGAQEAGGRTTDACGSRAGGRVQGTERLREGTRPSSPVPGPPNRAPCPEGGGPAAAGPVPTGGASGGGGQPQPQPQPQPRRAGGARRCVRGPAPAHYSAAEAGGGGGRR